MGVKEKTIIEKLATETEIAAFEAENEADYHEAFVRGLRRAYITGRNSHKAGTHDR